VNILDLAFVAAVLTASTPVLLAGLGGLLCSQAGVFNIALEGQMLWGAFVAVAVSYWTGSAWGAVLAAAGATVLFAAVLSVGAVTWKADPILVAVGTNLLALGLTGLLMRVLWNAQGTFDPEGLAGLPRLAFLDAVPVLGKVLGAASPLVPAAIVATLLAGFWLRRHPLGLRLRGVGEHPEAATSLGVSVPRYRHTVTLVAGALCGIAGAQLSLGNVTLFAENITSSRGWIAVAAVLLAANRPGRLLGACLLFGMAEAWGFRLQGVGLPQQITDAAPYVVTLVVLVVARLRFARRQSATGAEVPANAHPEEA